MRHNLDVVHIENVCYSSLRTLFNLHDKTMDNTNACKDFEKLGIRPALYTRKIEMKVHFTFNGLYNVLLGNTKFLHSPKTVKSF